MAETGADKENKRDDSYDFRRLLSISSFVAVSVIVGLPLWWKTTQTYRVSLPYDRIQDLTLEQLSIPISVEIVAAENTWSNENMQELQRNLQAQLNDEKLLLVVENYNVSTREAKETEVTQFARSRNLDDFSEAVASPKYITKIGQPTIFILSSNTHLLVGGSKIYLDRHRFTFIKSTSNLHDDTQQIKDVLLNILINREALQTSIANVVAPHLIRPEKATMRTLRSSPAYDITFNLIVPQPNIVKATWVIEGIIQRLYECEELKLVLFDLILDCFQPMFQKLTQFMKFNVKSQVLYLTSLSVKPQYDTERKLFYLTPEQLPHVLNPIEIKLGSHVSTKPNINFVVYIPTKEQSPLHIYDSTGNPSPTNAFLSPRWGGIYIYNDNSSSDEVPQELTVNPERMASVFLAQIRLLLGLIPLASTDSTHFASFDETMIMDWELDNLLRKNTLENIATSSNTLRSLSQLLGQIENIVINDEVGNSVFEAVEATLRSIEYLKQGNLLEAFLSSLEGHVAAEKAFFDPSMLALLYFPNDQKYAVYVPLFLPVGVPIVLSIFYLVHAIKASRNKVKVE